MTTFHGRARPIRRGAVLAAAMLLVLTGCSKDDKVGEGLGVKGGGGEAGCRLGECATTTAPTTAQPKAVATTVATTAPKPTTTTTNPQVTTTSTTAPKQATFAIKIQSDSAQGGIFSPRVASVRVGVVVRWTNTDTVPRSVEADDGSFASGELAPGAAYDYLAATAGSFNYHDGTRPYAVGTLQVG